MIIRVPVPILILTLLLASSTVLAEDPRIVAIDVATDLEQLYGMNDTSYRLGFANVSVEICGYAKSVRLETLNESIAVVLKSDVLEDLNGCANLSAWIRFGNWISLGNATALLGLCFSVEPSKTCLDLGTVATVCLYDNVSSSFNNVIDVELHENATVKICRDGSLVFVTNETTTWIDPIPGPHTYRFAAIIDNTSIEATYIVHGNRYCVPLAFNVTILPRIVDSLPMNIYPNSTFSVSNPAKIDDIYRLEVFVDRIEIRRPIIDNSTKPRFALVKQLYDVVLRANQTLLQSLGFDLSLYRGANVTLFVWVDDSTGVPGLRKFSIALGNPLAQRRCDVVVRVVDDWGSPIEEANITFGNVSTSTNASGIAILENIYPAGLLTVKYGNYTVKSWVLGCSPKQIVIDTHPPILLNVSVKPCGVIVRAIDNYSYVFAVLNGSRRYGPFNGTYYIHLEPGTYLLCVVDSFGNVGNCTIIDVPPEPREHIDYALLSLYILLMGCVVYVALALVLREH